jgi:hypothetical protein
MDNRRPTRVRKLIDRRPFFANRKTSFVGESTCEDAGVLTLLGEGQRKAASVVAHTTLGGRECAGDEQDGR